MYSFLRRYRIWIEFILFVSIAILTLAVPVLAQSSPAIDSCNDIVDIPDTWKAHFPFDLVYPIGQPYTSDGTCPNLTFWGNTYPVCSVPQITAIVKNVFLARVAINGLFYL